MRKTHKVTPRRAPGDDPAASREKVKIGCGNLYITVNYDENGICEVFTNLGRAGGCPSASPRRPAAWFQLRCAPV